MTETFSLILIRDVYLFVIMIMWHQMEHIQVSLASPGILLQR